MKKDHALKMKMTLSGLFFENMNKPEGYKHNRKEMPVGHLSKCKTTICLESQEWWQQQEACMQNVIIESLKNLWFQPKYNTLSMAIIKSEKICKLFKEI